MDELDVLLERVGEQGYMLHAFRVDQHGPDIMAVVRDHGGIADVLIIFDDQHAWAHRTPTGSGIDVFAPRAAYWWYVHTPVWTLRALMTLAEPGHPNAPTTLRATPDGYGIPSEGRMPVRMRKCGR